MRASRSRSSTRTPTPSSSTSLPDSSSIQVRIGRSQRTPTRMPVSARGRAARSTYEVVTPFDEPARVALVRCTLDTGRTHQIRVHLQTIGHPVVGDRRYGGHRVPFTDLP